MRDEDGEGVLAFRGALSGHLQVRDDLLEHYPSGANAAERRKELYATS